MAVAVVLKHMLIHTTPKVTIAETAAIVATAETAGVHQVAQEAVAEEETDVKAKTKRNNLPPQLFPVDLIQISSHQCRYSLQALDLDHTPLYRR